VDDFNSVTRGNTGRYGGEKKQKGDSVAMFAEGDSIDKIARVTGISQKKLKTKLSRK